MRLNKYYDKIQCICDSLGNLIGELEEKQNVIEENAIVHDRDMTSSEQKKFDEYECLIATICDCIESLEFAKIDIESYCN